MNRLGGLIYYTMQREEINERFNPSKMLLDSTDTDYKVRFMIHIDRAQFFCKLQIAGILQEYSDSKYQ